MRTVTEAQVHKCLDYPRLVAALQRAHRGEKPLVGRSEVHHQKDEQTRQSFLNLPAWLPDKAMGLKSISVMPGNETAHNLPTVHAVYLLFDGVTGEPSAVIDGTSLTLRKTAADSALGSMLLSAPDVSSMLMVGAGAMAPHLVAAHRAVRPSISKIMVWNRTAHKADLLVHDLVASGIDATRVDDLREPAMQADLICCATSSTKPVIEGAWLRPGTHLDLVGSFTADMRETDDDVVRRADIYVDSRWFAIDEPGDLVQPIKSGVISADDVRGDLFDLCATDYVVDRNDETITFFKNGGGAHLDLFTALHLINELES